MVPAVVRAREPLTRPREVGGESLEAAVQAAASKDKPLLERAWAARDLAKIVDLALGWPLYFAKKFAATVRGPFLGTLWAARRPSRH